jgi:hypothetical protein
VQPAVRVKDGVDASAEEKKNQDQSRGEGGVREQRYEGQ